MCACDTPSCCTTHIYTDNLLEQEQEVVALQSIYPDQFQYDELRRICTVHSDGGVVWV